MRVGVIGATGAVGRELVEVLGRRRFPVTKLRLFASGRSAGTRVETPFGPVVIEEFSQDRARDLDLALLAVSGDFAKAHAPGLVAAGVTVVDNSSAFRLEDAVPLVVPEVNAAALGEAKLIANPNCTTAILVVALAPLHAAFGLKRVIVSTYQAASGAGAEGMTELERETRRVLVEGEPARNEVFAHPLAFNVIPHIDTFQPNAYTREEMKVTWETRKIMGLPDLPISCTAVRIPTMRVHAESVTIETLRPVTAEAARAVLRAAAGVRVVDEPARNLYPMPLTATGQDDVEAGRIRANPVFGDHGLDLFLCGDQLLKGAALNAVQIAERLPALQVPA
ncbi:aspartate-semialdehyde dehydrogenase [Falsiroseomonas selenitidurans]|uniref:Aspartate-semialdehyde dehydrogenase n=1 Tax=Falsiroseomonas selenitidurans TaxID=2716335 RepID=A0ABX1E398_9PROT|nr:aspartate-semialdehyde dehydrogenase [Falsiroseomonas selenitidurans]NKC29440.1 aspartate-semialdehyde dehydrogenase [Falsiroseomonas selenitidurans]OYW51547.1 MAG: aspartate-semialdehyde dehydrogenase [Rhizobiales bacterium 12-68-15]